ncbi:hypothetical protein [Cohnella fermenti]|uniref:Uncharacterized protein n=1 Tax=Cohnella fermenti TaxID=2565925 RepID=A0A4S4BH80_9BACL|nr:hypothetical protein [Cohnella fermenti]THF72777.1 hypothetical protein E6C55_31975 [Cohnella fermenti]
MEKLIDFILSNIYFVIVAIGLVYGMFFRKSSDSGKKPNRMPDFGGGGARPGTPQAPSSRPGAPGEPAAGPRPAARPAAPREREQPRYRLPERPETASAPEAAPVRPAPVHAAERAPKPAQAGVAAASPYAASAPASPIYASSPGGLQPTREELARAVVWAEVLGPPRARKPFRRGW